MTILGSGTLFPNDARRSAAHFVEAGGVRLLMDCGSGTVHGMARHPVDWRRLTHLAITHFHTDHVGDIPALFFALKHGVEDAREAPLTVLGPPGLIDFWKGIASVFGEHLSDPGFPLEVIELERTDSWRSGDGRLRVRTHPTLHTDSSIAFRVETDEGVVGYTGDTGPDATLGDFFRDVDVLIAECSLPDPSTLDTHLTPAGLAALAERAGAGIVVATHLYPQLDPSRVPALVAQAGYTGRVRVGEDGMLLNINRTKG